MQESDDEKNLLAPEDQRLAPEPRKKGKRLFPKIFWTIVIIILIVFGVIFAKAYSVGSRIFVNHQSFFKTVSQMFFPGSTTLKSDSLGQVNIILFGYGGAGHDGPYLTDSILLASINTDTKQVVLTSIPRDYYYPQGESSKKINEAYYDGYYRTKDPLAGFANAQTVFQNLSGETIPYFAALDFTGFTDAIDRVGGLDINVPDSFTDYTYPVGDNSNNVKTVSFTVGQQHMDGERALEYARSRHAAGPEGSDFARGVRQQLIIEAFKQKVLGLGVSDASEVNDLLNIISKHFVTNMQPAEIIQLVQLLHDPKVKVVSQSLDPDTNLICPKILDTDGEYVLIPCDGVTDQQIQNFFQNGWQTAGLRNEHASIILEQSGTNTGLYNDIKTELKTGGVSVYEVPYRGITLPHSVLYEVQPKPATEKFLEDKLGIQTQPKPSSMTAKSDLVLIVGSN